jgi:hypothetical protein
MTCTFSYYALCATSAQSPITFHRLWSIFFISFPFRSGVGGELVGAQNYLRVRIPRPLWSHRRTSYNTVIFPVYIGQISSLFCFALRTVPIDLTVATLYICRLEVRSWRYPSILRYLSVGSYVPGLILFETSYKTNFHHSVTLPN